MLRVTDLRAYYGRSEALHGVSLFVERGEVITVLGLNGAGKTTLLRCIAGLHSSKTGIVELNGRSTLQLRGHQVTQLGLAHVMQGRGVLAGMTVMDNLQLGAYTLRKRPHAERRQFLDAVLELFPALKERLKQRAGTLSGGEQQMLAIGRSLMAQPAILLLDEPSLGLAPIAIEPIFATLERINRDRGLTIVLVEQNPALALRAASRCYVLANGEVALDGASVDGLTPNDIARLYMGFGSNTGRV